MIMVRRRARPVKEAPSSGNGVAGTGVPDPGTPLPANLLEDQYFASPKRKDCRLMKASEHLGSLPEAASDTNVTNKGHHHKDKTSGEFCCVPLATRSQTRTIDNFFKANAAAKEASPIEEQKTIQTQLEEEQQHQHLTDADEELKLADEELQQVVEELLFDGSSTSSSNSPSYPHHHQHHDELQEIKEIQEMHEIQKIHEIHEIQEHLLGSFQTHRSTLRDSHSSTHSSSTTSDNIFLQEPVLTLDIDRTPTKASSIKINRSFEITGAVFSSPPSVLNACVLPGRFNQIVSLNGQKEVPLPEAQNFHHLDQHDSSSCDSGVACAESPAAGAVRRRKPATPHRILCPSPIKAGGVSKGGGAGDGLSPRKSPRKLPATTAAVTACKSRRRLNHPKPQAPYQPQLQQLQKQKPTPQQTDDIVVVLDEEDEELDEEEEDDMHALLKAAEERENQNKAPDTAKSNNKKIMLKPAPAKPKNQTRKVPAKGGPLPLAATNGNREMTDFFPVRRSVRKTKTVVKEEWLRGLEQAVLEERCEGLQVRHFMGKGRGVVAERPFKRNEFVVEYVGDLISVTDASEREKRYALDENAGCYMYYFKHKNQQYCIDATVDTGKLGRLINHSRAGNLMTKVVVIKQRPHLVLLAKDDIEPGEELTYDYGDRSKESLLHHPWLAF
ncbi:hypothetical protein KR009_007988 [Drosophila setifemur]|nr:hypothetical protein KR009_007988 [Drosophila setifemur]